MQTPAPFEYERATSVDGAIASLVRLGADARIIAGGHSLLPMMKLRLANPEHLIDINDLTELSFIRKQGDEICIGAMTRHVELLKSDLLREHFPLFHDAEMVIADPVVRNRGTIGGSLCQADPAEDLSAVCSAIKAVAVIRSQSGERVVGMEEFHVGPYTTAVGEGEMVTEIRIPLRPGGGSAHEKVERRAGDWAIAALGGRRLGRRRQDRRRGHRAQRRRPDHDPRDPGGGSPAREDAVRGRSSRRLGRWPPPIARRAPTAGDRSTTSATSQVCSPNALSVGRRPARSARRPEHMHTSLSTSTGSRTGRRRAAAPAGPLHPRGRGAHRDPLGLRHVQLRRLRDPDGRPADEVVHRSRRHGRGARDQDGRGPRGRRLPGPDPGRLPREPRPALRLLHAGHAHDHARTAG